MNTEIKNVIIAGAGTMGSSIAQVFAGYGYNVTIYDIMENVVESSKRLISLNQQTEVQAGNITQAQSDMLVAHICHSTDNSCFKTADFVSESIVERIEIKHSFWKEISEIVPENIILSTNTSGLSITKIASVVKNPSRFVGMHWVNPPHIIPLVEVIKGDETSEECAKITYDLASKIGKKPIYVKKDVPGFALNRIQFAVLREALHLVESGVADFEDVDNVLKYGLGMRYACFGPFEVADLGGLDTFSNITSYLFEDLAAHKDQSPLLKKLVEEGKLGVKTKAGIYDYADGKDEQVIQRRDEMFNKLSKILFANEQ